MNETQTETKYHILHEEIGALAAHAHDLSDHPDFTSLIILADNQPDTNTHQGHILATPQFMGQAIKTLFSTLYERAPLYALATLAKLVVQPSEEEDYAEDLPEAGTPEEDAPSIH